MNCDSMYFCKLPLNRNMKVDFDSVPDFWIKIEWTDDALVQRNIYAGAYRPSLSFL